MSSEVEEQKTEPDAKLSESSEAMNFSKQTFKHPNKLNLTRKRKLKLKRHLKRQNSRLRLESCFKKKNGNYKSSRRRIHKGKFFTCSYKRRKKEHGVIIPPTKFLLGGNICDPLNLNSLQDEETNRAVNAVTPKSSPLPTTRHRRGEIEVIIPRNIKDPLNLASCNDENEYEMDLKLMAKRRKNRHRKRKRGSSGSGSGKDDNNDAILVNVQDDNVTTNAEVIDNVPRLVETEMVPEESEVQTKPIEKGQEDQNKTCQSKREVLSLTIKENPKHLGYRARKMDDKDKIVSPVIPQPGAWKKPRPYPLPPKNKRKSDEVPTFKPKNARYQYGNYDRYYGYRNPYHEMDFRLKCFLDHKHLFFDKDILDIGCNIGHITLSVARDFGARSAVGLDIDKKLINIARKNVKHYVNFAPTPAYSGGFSIINPPPMESPMCYDGKKNHYVFQDSPGLNSRGTPLYSYPESPVNRSTHQYCMESPSYTPSGRNTPYYSMESPSYHPSISGSPNYRRSYAFDSPSYVQQSPNYHSGRNTPFCMESPSYQSLYNAEPKRSPQEQRSVEESYKKNCDKFFPISMPILYGPVDPPGISTQEDSSCPKKFPHNVTFVQGNYVLESDVLLQAETPQFDVILALSITKWIHLNWGDAGLKQAFRRMYTQLRPGGVLILECQSWSSYMKKKNLTENIYNNFHSIEFMPHQFTEYLLSPEVGFSKVEVIGAPVHMPKGFQRIIQVFTKSESTTPSSSNTPARLSTPSNIRYAPYFSRQNDRQPVYSALTVSSSEMDDDVSQSPKPNFPNNLIADTGQTVRVKFSPSDAEPRGAKLDVSEDILRGSEISLSVTKDVDQGTIEIHRRGPKEKEEEKGENEEEQIQKGEVQQGQNQHQPLEEMHVKIEDNSSSNKSLPDMSLRNSTVVIDRKSSKVKALVSPV